MSRSKKPRAHVPGSAPSNVNGASPTGKSSGPVTPNTTRSSAALPASRKKAFSVAERFAVWKAFDGTCFWCRAPVELANMVVDHVLPESLNANPSELLRVRTALGLPDGFDLNSFENWVPSDLGCNTQKRAALVYDSPAVQLMFTSIAVRAGEARKAWTHTKKQLKKDKTLGRILVLMESAKDAGTLTLEEVQAAARSLFVQGSLATGSPKPEADLRLNVSPEWAILRRDGNLVVVSRGNQVGTTWAGGKPDPTWFCPHCGRAGPWNGVICMTCGMRSDPYD